MSITTAWANQAKTDLASAGQCHLTQVAPTGTTVNTSQTISAISSMVGLAVGMPITGTGIPATTVISALLSSTSIQISAPASASNSGVTLTCGGDIFKFALIKHTPAGTYGAASQFYSDITGNSDEVSGTGYSAGGFAWTAAQNQSPAVGSNIAFWQPSVNPSWTSATIDSDGGMMYDTTVRLWPGNRCVACFDFGGEQKVTGGTFTVVLPTNASGTALLRLS